MFPVMNSASKINGFMFALLMVVMLAYSVPKVVHFTTSQEETLDLFLDGELLRKFETVYDKEFFLRDGSVKAWANLQFMLFGEGSSGVVMGKDGWLFTNEEYLFPNDYSDTLDKQLDKIAKVAANLNVHHKRLILVPVPMKLDVYSEYAEAKVDERTHEIYADFVNGLKARQIEVAPVRDAFMSAKGEDLLYLKTDTHWTPAGAHIAAQEFARQHPELKGEEAYSSSKISEKAMNGDLMNFLQFGKWLAPELFQGDTIPVFETTEESQAVDDSALFGDTQQNIMLVGSSYTKIDDWNFVGFLKEALHNDLLTTAVEAKGPFYAMREFVNGEQFGNESIDTVIWEFPVRTLISQKPNKRSWQATMDQFF